MLGTEFIKSQQAFIVSVDSIFTLQFCLKSKGFSRTQDNKCIIQFDKNNFHRAKTQSDKYLEKNIKMTLNYI